MMTMTVDRVKKFAVTLFALPLFAVAILDLSITPTRASVEDFDAAAVYKAKCAMCHGAKAEKKFDPAKTDDQLVEVILKGKDGTPKMPAYEGKLSAEQAKALVAYMKSLKQS